MDLSHARHAFVTGGASGIGLATADALARHGLSVTIADIDESTLAAVLAQRGERFHGTVLDTRDRVGWRAAKQAAENKFGPVDILVNNAGIGPDGREFADMDPRSFDRIIAINLTGIFNGVSTFAADLRARGTGHIVNTSSIAGLTAGRAGCGAYWAAKFGAVGLSEILRMEMASHGVGVSVLCPGQVPTNLGRTTAKLNTTRGGDPNAPMGDFGVSAAMVADYVIRGIVQNQAYIFTHADNARRVERRMNDLRQAFETAPTAELEMPLLDAAKFRHAFVTGGASGIGLAIVDALIDRGLSVTIADIDEQTLATVVAQRGARVTGVMLDTRDRTGWRAAKQTAESRFGPVDILVNNAGIAMDGHHLADIDPASFERTIAINLTGVFNGVSAFASDLRARGSGHIVNTASLVSLTSGIAGMGDYTAAKYAVVGLSEGLRLELAPHGVGVSALCPGYVQTNLHANTAKLAGDGREELKSARTQAGKSHPVVGRYVVHGIANNLPYIITHPEHGRALEPRTRNTLAAFQMLPPNR